MACAKIDSRGSNSHAIPADQDHDDRKDRIGATPSETTAMNGGDESSVASTYRRITDSVSALPTWVKIPGALALMAIGVWLAFLADPAAFGEDPARARSAVELVLLRGSGLLLAGFGQTILVLAFLEEPVLRRVSQESNQHVQSVVEEAVGDIETHLGRSLEIVGDSKREHLIEILPPRRNANLSPNPESFERLWALIVDAISASCVGGDEREIQVQFSSVAQKDMFHPSGLLSQRFSELLTRGEIDRGDGHSGFEWFCGCGNRETCTKKVAFRMIILDPTSEAVGERVELERGTGQNNEVRDDINKTINLYRDMLARMTLWESDSISSRISLEVKQSRQHPTASFVRTADLVAIELGHFGRVHGDHVHECLGGRVPVLVFRDKSPIHVFLGKQFGSQWTTPYEADTLGWLGTSDPLSPTGGHRSSRPPKPERTVPRPKEHPSPHPATA